ncbi:MAG: efflux RND transporter permease subunit, partial [Planctomycetes bacterium]|nr:efflux RND transporter permease subunit [Planctomycetota bacterium]
MNLAKFSVHRPIFTTMVALIVIILGGISLVRLPIDLLPDITYPTISVRTTYENASPQEMEELVTRPIEEAVSAVPGVETVTSVSAEGTSSVRAAFTWGTDLDAGANDIRDRLDRVVARLPEEADRPMVMKFDLGMYPILILGASSNLDPVQLRRIIEDQIKYRIERVPGVAALDIFGGLEREIHVNLNPEKIKALGLPLDLILTRVKEGNINLPGGLIDRGNYEIMVRTPGTYSSLRELEDTVIAIRQGAPIQLKEIATVEDSWQKVREVVRVDGRPGVRLAVRKQSGTNTVQVARAALREIEQVNQDIPQVRLSTIIDTSDYIERSVTNVGTSALQGGALAILILLFFLRNVASTVVIATTIPISIIATFALMYFGGLTLNLMTLGGLALGVGMLVDNAIVVLENTYRLRESGMDPERAAVEGSGEVVAAITASTLTTLVVFLPLIFVRGMAGVMFKQLSIVISFSLLCSLVAAVTLVPMLCVKLIRRTPGDAARKGLRGMAFRACGWFLTRLDDSYGRLLRAALGHRFLVVFAALALLGASLAMV